MAIMGRASIFREKDGGDRVQGVITRRGAQAFEWKRQELAALYERIMGRAPTTVSDADVIEFMARGEKETKLYLKVRLDK
jgi:hypothetical protein